MKNIVLAALLGAVTFECVSAAKVESNNFIQFADDDSDDNDLDTYVGLDNILELENGKDKKKSAESEEESSESSSTDAARHKAHKDPAKKSKSKLLAEAKKKSKQDKLDRKKPIVKRQTLESLNQASAEALENAGDAKKKADELNSVAMTKRKDYEAKYKSTNLAAKAYHESKDDMEDASDVMKRAARRLEHSRHDALHEAIIEQKARIHRRKQDEKELKDKAKEEATMAASSAGATATQSINAAKQASKGL
jgi:hypothetical protein